jgi:apolipoprotein N-acyltransferase
MHSQQIIAAICLGILQALSLSALFEDVISAAVQIISMALFLKCLNNEKQIFKIAWLFASAWLIGSVWWLYIALHVHGHLPATISIFAILLLCCGLALYYATAVYVYFKYKNNLNAWQQALLIAACWTMAEMARAQWFTGFPWAAIGYAQINSNLSLAAPWVGVYGIGFLAVLIAAYISNLEGFLKAHQKINTWSEANPRKNKIHRWSILLISIVLLWPVTRDADNSRPNLSVALLQGNIPQDIKFSNGREEALDWYQQQSLASQADLTVLPETALPYLKRHLPENYFETLTNKFNGSQQIGIIGMLTETQTGYANSAAGMGIPSEPKTYNKYHLVPFGEFTPDILKWFTSMIAFGLADFERGSEKAEPFKWQAHKIAVNICYEDVFGEELAKRFVQGSENVPTVLVNISNIDWFGDTVVIPQHLNIARMRSLEFNRPSIRATNSGGTAIISAQGEITRQLQPFTRGVLQGRIASVENEITPFAYWAGHWGLKPLWLLCLGISVVLIRLAKKNDSSNKLQAVANVK